MTKQTLNIEIGKICSASLILREIQNYPSRLQIGHAVLKIKGVNKHLYHIDEKTLENLKDTELKILSIINPSEQNFAHKLIMQEDTQENLKKIKAQKNLCYAVDMNDLAQAGYKFKGTKCAINCINRVFKTKGLSFTASDHSEGKIDKKHFVKISYKVIDNTMDNTIDSTTNNATEENIPRGTL